MLKIWDFNIKTVTLPQQNSRHKGLYREKTEKNGTQFLKIEEI